MMYLFPGTRLQEIHYVEACFESYAHGSYCFVDVKGTSYEFQNMEPSAQEKYDLTDGNYQGRTFCVVYTIETINYEEEKGEEEENDEDEENDNNEYQEYIIVDLELVG